MVLYGLDYRILYVCLYNTPIDVQYSMKLRHRKKKKKRKQKETKAIEMAIVFQPFPFLYFQE